MDKWEEIQKVLSDPRPPEDHLDTVLADAMKQLSVKDRERFIHEVHGVFDGKEHTPEFVSAKLEEMGREVANVRAEQKFPTTAYELAESLSPEYVADPKFRLRFLRNEDFKPKPAVERMMMFFDFKFSMFGGDQLCRPIRYDDLDRDDIDALEKGFLQWLPERDRSGRPVLVFFPSLQRYRNGCDIGRVFGRLALYLVVDNEEIATCAKGCVMLIYNVGKFDIQRLYPQVPPIVLRMLQGMPMKVVAIHICFSSFLFRIVAQGVLEIVFSRELRAGGGKIHQGTQIEVKYSLMTFGIPTDLLPVDSDDGLKRNHHLEMISMMRQRDECARNEGGLKYVIIPSTQDVLLAKGGPFQERPANVSLKVTVDELLPVYGNLGRTDKINLQRQIVRAINERGGRFLSKESGVWTEVPEDVSRAKVATLFRNRRKAAKTVATKKDPVMKTSRSEENSSSGDVVRSGENKRSKIS